MTTDAQGETGSGCLYLVATPIGNLEDITLRAIRILKEADLIACEDTRQTQKLLQHYGIQKELVSYHAHNELTRAPELVIELEQGAKAALVSDAGTPVVSDPGIAWLRSACGTTFPWFRFPARRRSSRRWRPPAFRPKNFCS